MISVIFHREPVTAAPTSSSTTAASTSTATGNTNRKCNAKNNESVLLVIR